MRARTFRVPLSPRFHLFVFCFVSLAMSAAWWKIAPGAAIDFMRIPNGTHYGACKIARLLSSQRAALVIICLRGIRSAGKRAGRESGEGNFRAALSMQCALITFAVKELRAIQGRSPSDFRATCDIPETGICTVIDYDRRQLEFPKSTMDFSWKCCVAIIECWVIINAVVNSFVPCIRKVLKIIEMNWNVGSSIVLLVCSYL